MSIEDESDFVSYVEASEFLQKLARSAPKLGLNEASTVHIDRLLKALHSSTVMQSKQGRIPLSMHFGPPSSGFA